MESAERRQLIDGGAPISKNRRRRLQMMMTQIYENNICDDLHNTVLCSLEMQFNKHAVVLMPGRGLQGMPCTHFFL